LNDREIAALKPNQKRQEIAMEEKSLYLVVQPSGTKTFQFRPRVQGKLIRRTLGTYPTMTLRKAKATANRLRAELEDSRLDGSVPPMVRAVPLKSPQGVLTTSQAFALYMAHEGHKRASAGERWRIFRADIEPVIGRTALDEVNRDQIERMLIAKAETAPVASNVIYTLLHRFFRWCTKEGHGRTKLDTSVMDNVAKVGSDGEPRDRWLTDYELGLLGRALPEAGVFANGLLACLFTGQRRGRIFGATREQLEGDILTIGLKDPKPNRQAMTTPIWLHPFVMASIPEATKDTSPTEVLFEGRTDDLNKATNRVVAKMQELAAKDGKTVEHWSPHDLRRTMSNWMGDQIDENDEPVFDEFIIERCLSHIERSVRAKHYSSNRYLASKKRAWLAWGNHLEKVLALG